MDFEYKKVTPADDDFIELVRELSASLEAITADTGEGSFAAEAFDADQDGCLVVYAGDAAVACGIFRYQAEGVCELKRMYSKQPGAGSYLLQQLEAYAAAKGYRQALLSTRRVNQKAVGFYLRNGYHKTQAYGRYLGVARSVCFGKTLFG